MNEDTLFAMRLPRWAVPVVGVIIVIGALASRELNDRKERAQVRADALASEQASVRITASFGEPCSGDQPVRVTVKNTTSKRLESVTFHVGVYEAGRVDDLAPGGPDEQWSSKLKPGAEETRCLAASLPASTTQILKVEKRGAGAVFGK